MRLAIPAPAQEARATGAFNVLAGLAQAALRSAATGRVAKAEFVLVTGFLGAGKTTLVQRLLRDAGERRIAVLVNDFGSLSIDAALIRRATSDTIELANGCVCCSLASGLANALADLTDRKPLPDLIVLEASGIAEPLSILHVALANPALRFAGVVTLVDAEHVVEQLADIRTRALIAAQLAAADILLLNKIDRIDEAGRAAAAAALREKASDSRLIATTWGQAPLEAVFGLEPKPAAPAPDFETHARFVSRTFVAQRALDPNRCVQFVRSLPASVVRAKGLIAVSDTPDRRKLLQVVGSHWSLEDAGPSEGETQQSSVVVIGWPDESELAELDKRWNECAAPKETP